MSPMEKLAAQSLEEALAVAKIASALGLRFKLAAAVPGEVKPSRLLRSHASVAWHMGASPPKPKSIKPNLKIGEPARETHKAMPPSKKAFFRDMVLDPMRGNRLAVKG